MLSRKKLWFVAAALVLPAAAWAAAGTPGWCQLCAALGFCCGG